MKQIRYSAPGKVIITGEHAVVYGKPALVCAIDRRLSITFIPSKKTIYHDEVFPQLEKAVIAFLESRKEKINKIGYTYTVESSIPIGRGLGSSAAYCATIGAGLLELFTGREWSKEDVNVCAYQMEKLFHKNSSGVDTSTSVMGGLIYYRKEFEFLKTISSLAIKIPKNFIDTLHLIDTGKPVESTGEMVQMVGAQFNEKNEITEGVLGAMEKTTKRIIVSLMREDLSFFRKNIQDNEALLEELGVVSGGTRKILLQLKNAGVGKITGAGGAKGASGYLLFSSMDNNLLHETAKKMKISVMPFVPSYSGLVKEL